MIGSRQQPHEMGDNDADEADHAGHRHRRADGATLAALIYALVRRNLADAGVVWLTYASHWPADYLTGYKPTWPGGPWLGQMLYARPTTDLLLESLLVLVCWLVYRRALPPAARRHPASYLIPIGLIAMQLAFTQLENPLLGAP